MATNSTNGVGEQYVDSVSVKNSENKGRIGTFFDGFSDQVDLSGLPTAADPSANRGRRWFWIFLLLFGVCFALYQIISQIIVYFSYPVNVYVNIEAVNHLHFPSVTICNKNTWNYSRLQNLAQVQGHQSLNINQIAGHHINQGNTQDIHSFHIENSLHVDDILLKVFIYNVR